MSAMRTTTCSQDLRPAERVRHFNRVRRRIAGRYPRQIASELAAQLVDIAAPEIREMVRHEYNRPFAQARRLMEVPA